MYDLTPAIDLIKSFESCALTAYQDMVGVWTIGWGHTGDVEPGHTLTQDQADALLLADVTRIADGVARLVHARVNQNQFCALVSFSYNLGLGSLKRSTLLKWLNGGEHPEDVAEQFLKWDYADGREVPGLERRRQAEQQLFVS